MVRGTHRRSNAIFAHLLPGQSHMVGAHPLDLAALEAEDPEHWIRRGPAQTYSPRPRPMISFMISVVPPKMDWTRLSVQARPTAYSRM
jgi:hypothetical protein